ncbi:peptide/nickel transport system ATP-binding protein [Microvirga lupini]|uniref:Peptide/nickel transport system ATP-binding protein n=1 Tax=Microvirga lupini TaxID=420324 RepID=A0A7W4YZ95_9HYPH|nr:ABC transporter ATP-binding protein [Microvirga lupini]MBB3021094.1 peptide/nickel transport system ATP-binding protein [Microvirga lupini]
MTAQIPLLDVRNIEIQAANSTSIVKSVNLTLAHGAMAALVGESGSGKTMASRSVLRLLPPGVRMTRGEILLEGENLAEASEKRMRQLRGRSLGMIFQEPMVSLNPAMSVGAQMAEALRLHTSLSRQEIRQLCIEMLERVRISNAAGCLTAFPHEFSGGMRQRIMIASVMLLRPKLLVADEPTTALDTLAQREVLDLLTELARDFNTAVLLITHNLGLVARYTENMTVLREGRVVEAGKTASIIAHPYQTYTRKLIAAAKASQGLADDVIPPDAPAVLRATDVSVTYGARTHGRGHGAAAVSEVSLDIRKGETVAVVGGSGSGKTTLGRALLGLVPLSSGRVEFEGRNIIDGKGAIRREARLGCQMVFQDPYSSLDPRQRIGSIVHEPLRHVQDMAPADKERRVSEVLAEVGLSGLERRLPHELSGGQRQRVAIARALVRRPPLVVADEPVSALDMTIQAQVLELIRDLQASYGFACLFISHDLTAVRRVAHRVIVMEAGRIVEQGATEDILGAPQHPYTARLIEAAPMIGDPAGLRPAADRAKVLP